MSYENKLAVAGGMRSSRSYGDDYLDEFRRVILNHVVPVTRNFLEWGMGHTTLAVLQMRHEFAVDRFDSIDCDADYVKRVTRQMPKWEGFEFHCCDLMGPKKSDRDPELNYSTLPLSWGRRFDFIFIDGRRRVECAFIASLLCHPDTAVVMHDYRRARYQSVQSLFRVVEDGSQFRVMKLREGFYNSLPPLNVLAGAA